MDDLLPVEVVNRLTMFTQATRIVLDEPCRSMKDMDLPVGRKSIAIQQQFFDQNTAWFDVRGAPFQWDVVGFAEALSQVPFNSPFRPGNTVLVEAFSNNSVPVFVFCPWSEHALELTQRLGTVVHNEQACTRPMVRFDDAPFWEFMPGKFGAVRGPMIKRSDATNAFAFNDGARFILVFHLNEQWISVFKAAFELELAVVAGFCFIKSMMPRPSAGKQTLHGACKWPMHMKKSPFEGRWTLEEGSRWCCYFHQTVKHMAGKASDITSLPGVGKATATKLKAAKFNTIAKIAKASTNDLKKAGLTLAVAKKVHAAAKAASATKTAVKSATTKGASAAKKASGKAAAAAKKASGKAAAAAKKTTLKAKQSASKAAKATKASTQKAVTKGQEMAEEVVEKTKTAGTSLKTKKEKDRKGATINVPRSVKDMPWFKKR